MYSENFLIHVTNSQEFNRFKIFKENMFIGSINQDFVQELLNARERKGFWREMDSMIKLWELVAATSRDQGGNTD